MSMYGADVVELRGLAAKFARAADQLDADRMAVGNAIQISAWVGPFATQFRVQWNSEHSQRIHNAAQLLRSAATSLRSNADDQERTSAVNGGPARSGEAWRGSGGATSARAAAQKSWSDVIDGLRGIDVGGIKPWQMAELGAKTGELMDAKVGWFGALNTSMDAIDVAGGIAEGRPEWDKIFHLAADGLGEIKNPFTQMLALNIHAWTYVGVEAAKGDFTPEGRNQVFSYIAQHPVETIGVVGESVVEVGRQFVSWLPIK